MSLAELLLTQGIKLALIVDDAYDKVPTAADIGPGNPEWPNFSDDLDEDGRALIEAQFPADGRRQDELVALDGYVETIWKLRDQLGSAAQLFSLYVEDMRSDEKYVEEVKRKLEMQGLACETSGRDFSGKTAGVGLIVIDLFLGKAQNEHSIDETKTRLREALESRRADPPLVILMSRSTRIDEKRDEFRDEVGLIDSAFRIVKKSELDSGDRFELQLQRLAENAAESRKLARFFDALDTGLNEAAKRTLQTLRKLKLSDIGQIQQLLLDSEGEAVGSYLVDVFDRILLHEIEAESGIIDAAIPLNDFNTVQHPPPYVAGSPELQDLVGRTLTQHRNRLRLPGSVNAPVTFGDVLKITDEADGEGVKRNLLVDIAVDQVLLVLTPACDLQRNGAPRVLLLVGTVKPLQVKDWSYEGDARTSSINIAGEDKWVKWQLKHIDTVARMQLEAALANGTVKTVARLREAHAIELQQRVLSGLGRIGLVAPMPATFAVEVAAYYADTDGRPVALDVPALADGAICFVGRDEAGKQAIRLVMTEGCVDGIHAALSAKAEVEIAELARKAFGHVTTSQDLRQSLAKGLELRAARRDDWTHIPSLTGDADGVPKMGLIAWNYVIPEQAIPRHHLLKAGIILLVKDLPVHNGPGLEQAIRSGLVDPPSAELGAN